MAERRRAERVGFGEATPGEAQSSNPPADPEMLEEGTEETDPRALPDDADEQRPERPAEGGDERYGGDPDAEPPRERSEQAG